MKIKLVATNLVLKLSDEDTKADKDWDSRNDPLTIRLLKPPENISDFFKWK